MTLLGISETAARLGVSTRQVQHLAARGELRQLARGVIDEVSVERFVSVRGGSHRRAWEEATAWAAVALLSGETAEWLGASQRSRLRMRLRQLTGPELVERSRQRASVSRYSAHSRAAQYLTGDVVSTAGAHGALGLTDSTTTDGYVTVADVDRLVVRHGLAGDDEGRVTLRATTMSLDVVQQLATHGTTLAALDLAESLDIRERRAGLDALDQSLDAFRG